MSLRRRLSLQALESRITPATPSVWNYRGSGGGGALYSPAWGWSTTPDPTTELAIASDMSGLYRSTDVGASWSMFNAAEIQGSHYAKVQFTNDPAVRYCLDYTVVGGLDLIRPSKSVDGGTTWTPLAADPTDGEAQNLFVDPQNPQRVIVSDYSQLFLSTDGGASFNLRISTGSGNGLHLGGAFFDGNNIYVGTNQGLYTSSNGGTSFSLSSATGIPGAEAIVSFSGAKSGATTRFFAVTLGSGDVYAGLTGEDFYGYLGVYTLDVGQPAWVKRISGLPTADGAKVYPFFVATSLNDVNTAYVAGGSDAGAPIIYKTTDAGGSWASAFNTTNNQNIETGWQGHGGDRGWGYGEYALGFAVAPQNSARVVITDLGGAHVTTNGGTTWQAAYVAPADRNPAGAPTPTGQSYHGSGLDNTTSWSIAWDSPTTMLLGNSDVRGQRSTDAGATWGFGYTGHTDNSMYRVIKHPASGLLYAATGTVHDMYQSTYLQDSRIDPGTGKVLYSSDGGATWNTLHQFTDAVVWVAHAPNNPNRLYAATAGSAGGVWVSSNINLGGSSTWTKLAAPPRTEGHAFNVVVLDNGNLVASYSGRRNSGGVFTASSGVFFSTDGGLSWADRSAAGMQYWTKDVVVAPDDPANPPPVPQSTWYAAVYSGWGGPPNGTGGLYRTTDSGQSWTRVNALDRVGSITIDPNDRNAAYLTTESDGLWHTTNLSAANPTFTRVANYPFRQPERVFFNPHNTAEVWVTSFGGGVYFGSTDSPPAVVETLVNGGGTQRSLVTSLRVTFSEPVTLAPGAFSLTGPGGAVSFALDTSTPGVAVLTFASLPDGDYTLTLPAGAVTDAGGQHPAGDYQFNFFRKFGDADGNGLVDNVDFLAFRTALIAGGPSIFDNDGDGNTDLSDFIAFRQRLGT